jgi:acetylornithine aminotransferase/acetylornithine/N-succinyldiaminopimelate aminotransferase
MTLATVQKAEAAHLIPTYERYPVLLTHGRGVYLWDASGKRYLDLLSGIGVNGLGHTHPAVKKAIVKQAGKMLHTSNLFFHEYQAELAAKLTKISGLDRAFFTNSGTEAIEGALKIARAYAQVHNKNGSGPKWRIIALDNSFHGRTYGALSVTGQKKYRAPFEPVVPGVKFVKLNDVADLEKKFDHTVCAILVEPIQGEGGIRPLTQEFLQRARELTKKSGALLIADEIQSGLGRTGKWFAYQHVGIQPDVVALAKPIAGGLPLGSILASSEAATAFHPGMHGTTFGGGPLTSAVAVAVLNTIEKDGLMKNAVTVGNYFRGRLDELAAKHKFVHEIRSKGLMIGVELDSPEKAKTVVKEALAKGVILNRTNDTVLRFLPPFILQKKHVDEAMKVIAPIFSRLEAK